MTVNTDRAFDYGPVALFVSTQDPALQDPDLAGEYGPEVKRVLLDAILTLDPERVRLFQTWWGTLELPVFRPVAATSAGTLDMGLDELLLWSSATTLTRDADADWAIPAAGIPWLLGTNPNIYIGVLSHLPTRMRRPLHEALSPHSWYLGLMAVNPANRLHRRVFSLVPGWVYNRGWITDDPNHLRPQEVFEGLPVAGYGPGPKPPTREVLRIAWQPRRSGDLPPRTYQEALAGLLAAYDHAERPLAFAVGRRHPVVEDLRSKLHDYALNPDHEGDGAPKAKYFARALGLGRDDWRLLAVQLISALQAAHPEKFKDNHPWGEQQQLKFQISAPVIGLNGRTAVVTAVWMVQDDGPVQLATVVPTKTPAAERREALASGDWAGLYAIAVQVADQARRDCRPTPVMVGGGTSPEVIPEGAAGFAWVNLPDTTTGFAAWLIAGGQAHDNGDRGAYISAPTFHHEPAIAWAEGFAGVLQAAGHDCTVTHAID